MTLVIVFVISLKMGIMSQKTASLRVANRQK